MLKINSATRRKIPRPFRFPWGSGEVIEEVSVRCSIEGNGDSWEPTIQLLRYQDGETQLRFCVYDGNKFRLMPLILGVKEIDALAAQRRRSKQIDKLLRRLTK